MPDTRPDFNARVGEIIRLRFAPELEPAVRDLFAQLDARQEQVERLTQERDASRAQASLLLVKLGQLKDEVAILHAAQQAVEGRLDAIRALSAELRTETRRIGVINTAENRPRTLPELTVFMWQEKLDAALLPAPPVVQAAEKERPIV